MSHIPVLLDESVEILDPQQGEFFIDGTLGNGGHAKAIVEKISPDGSFLGIDWDSEAIQKTESTIRNRKLKRLILEKNNYANIPKVLKSHELPKADGLLLDLGMSSGQLESSGRGFSFNKDEPLDMRYEVDPERPSASEIVNSFNKKELEKVFREYGEEKFSKSIAEYIVERRRKDRITTTLDLVNIINEVTPKYSKVHPATKVFMALRIFVNHELENLKKLLDNLPNIIKPSGKAAIISFHSLEDRLVKKSFKNLAMGGKVEILTKKPMTPSEEEKKTNPRSRSAKLRGVILK